MLKINPVTKELVFPKHFLMDYSSVVEQWLYLIRETSLAQPQDLRVPFQASLVDYPHALLQGDASRQGYGASHCINLNVL